ncbi:MAG: heavy metal-responsive transcriptional regulator [Planctomycetes bacterium]|nr:heavy metal-responsive transcriptional regulator [Planctomycetota bacterium]
METLTTGKLAKKAKVHIETIRHYERIGLIPEPSRQKSSRYRQYPIATVARIKFIKHAQGFGFSLKEIADILSLKHNPDSSFEDIKSKVKSKLVEIDKKIIALNEMKKALSKLIKSPESTLSNSECPVLTAFEIENPKFKE